MTRTLSNLLLWNAAGVLILLVTSTLHVWSASHVDAAAIPSHKIGRDLADMLYKAGEFARLRDMYVNCDDALGGALDTSIASLSNKMIRDARDIAILGIWPLVNVVVLLGVRRTLRREPKIV